MNNDIVITGLGVDFFTDNSRVHAVEDVNITFPQDTITALVGESGSGKSVLGLSILRLLPKTAIITGSCLFQGRDLYRLSEKEMRSVRTRTISLIPQNPLQSLNPVTRIRRQLEEPLRLHLRLSQKAARDHAEQDLRRFGFADPHAVGRQYSFQLSGGMNQRVISAMGLGCGPLWVIADEPTKGLDAILRGQVCEILEEARRQKTGSMLLITHDLQLAKRISDRVAVLYRGQIIEQGTVNEVMQSPAHPYTRGLLGSMPAAGMKPIPPPLPERAAQACACKFFPRCPSAGEKCRTQSMGDTALSPGRTVRCVRYA